MAKRFQNERIDLVVLDQNIDTSTSTGRLMFNMLASIAEFENDLRQERQTEGIANAKEKGVRFGCPPKLTDPVKKAIYDRRMTGATVSQVAKEFNVGVASVYRAIKSIKESDATEDLSTKIEAPLESL